MRQTVPSIERERWVGRHDPEPFRRTNRGSPGAGATPHGGAAVHRRQHGGGTMHRRCAPVALPTYGHCVTAVPVGWDGVHAEISTTMSRCGTAPTVPRRAGTAAQAGAHHQPVNGSGQHRDEPGRPAPVVPRRRCARDRPRRRAGVTGAPCGSSSGPGRRGSAVDGPSTAGGSVCGNSRPARGTAPDVVEWRFRRRIGDSDR